MITKIIVHNFQSHKHTELSPGKGLSVFTGESDSGKTAFVIRALRWCLFNEGRNPVRFKKNGKILANGEPEREDECYVTVVLDDTVSVTRKRAKNKNTYDILNLLTGEVSQFENFGTKVPEEVKQAIGTSLFAVDKDLSVNLNIVRAKERSLVDMTGNARAKVLGAFAGANIFDIAVRNIQTDNKNNRQEIARLMAAKENLDKKLMNFPDFKKIDEVIAGTDKLNLDKEAVQADINYCKDKLNSLSVIDGELEKHSRIKDNEFFILSAEPLLADIDTLVSEYKETTEMLKFLKNTATKLDTLEKERTLNEQVLKTKATVFSNLEKIAEAEASINKMQAERTAVEAEVRKLLEIKKNLDDIAARTTQYEKAVDTIKTNIQKYKEQYIGAVKTLGVCPVCMNIINDECIATLENQ